MKILLYIGLLLFSLYPVFSNALMFVTSIETKASDNNDSCQTGIGRCNKEYRVTWRQIPHPRDSEVIPSEYHWYGAIHEHENVSFSCTGLSATGSPSRLFPDAIITDCLTIPAGSTWKEMEDLWVRTYGATGPGVVSHWGSRDSRECVMFTAQKDWTSPIGEQLNTLPPMCIGAPPLDNPQCVIEGNPVFNFVINYGQDTGGMQQSTTINLRCDMPAYIKLQDATGNNGKVDLGWGYADVKVNGQALPVNVTPDPLLSLNITAALHGIATEVGVKEGFIVIVVGYQ